MQSSPFLPTSRRASLRVLLTAWLGCSFTPLRAFAKDATDKLQLAHHYRSGVDVNRYAVSEKYDGVRAVWDGQVLRFRSGLAIAAPAWFTALLPSSALDGELWLARGKFDETSRIVRRKQAIDDEWRALTYWIFEQPEAPGSFSERSIRIAQWVAAKNHPQIKAVEQFKISTHKALMAKLDDVVQAGGEGLMLHLADAPVAVGRSDVLLKLKPVWDAEATVVAHTPGRGKYAGMTGALRVVNAQGHEFKLGTGLSDEQRRNPPAVGSVVTYTYRDTTPKGKPRFARFLRVYDGV